MRDGVFNPIFLQVKSRFNAHQKESLLVDIRDSTFSPHHSFYIIAASFNPISLELDDRLLFIPSEELNVKVKPNEKYGIRRITVSLKEKSKAQWTTSLIPKSELVERLMEKFEEMSKYYK